MREPEPAIRNDRLEAACALLRTMARVYGLGGDEQGFIEVCRVLMDSWASMPPGPPPWCGLSADATPYEVSAVFGGLRREIRILVEAQGDPPSPSSYWDAAMKLSETLEARYGADLSSLRAVENLFQPLVPYTPGVIYLGAVFRENEPPWFKAYLHLMCAGKTAVRHTAYHALGRLGCADVWPDLESRLLPGDELLFLSLDLVQPRQCRRKLYIRHKDLTAASLAHASLFPHADHTESVRQFVDDLQSGGERLNWRGALTCLHLEPGRDAPVHAATQVRLYPDCARSDAELLARLKRAMRRLGIPTDKYEAMVAALASRPLEHEQGIHSWASIQWDDRSPVVTVYFSPRLYFDQYGPISLNPERMWPSPVSGS